jgi:predicted transcriptional regulator
MKPIVKLNWIELALDIHRFHVQQVKDEDHWTIERTAKLLNRSIGSVSQYLLIAEYHKVFEKDLKKINGMKEAVELIKRKQREHRLGASD